MIPGSMMAAAASSSHMKVKRSSSSLPYASLVVGGGRARALRKGADDPPPHPGLVTDVEGSELLLVPVGAHMDGGGFRVPPEIELLVHKDGTTHTVDLLDLGDDVRRELHREGHVGHGPSGVDDQLPRI